MKCIIIFLLFIFSFSSFGTHFRYGHISWKRLQGNNVEFTVVSAWRTSFISNLRLYFGDGTSVRPSYTVLNNYLDYEGESYTIVRYTVEHTYSSSSLYTAYSSSCCRISTLENAADDPFYLKTEVDLTNSNMGSPVSSIVPILQMSTNALNVVEIPVLDPDGDDISIRMAQVLESRISEYPISTYPLYVDGNFLKWDTQGTSVGDKYAVQLMLEEKRGSEVNVNALDFILEIVTGSPPIIIENLDSSEKLGVKALPNTEVTLKSSAQDSVSNSGISAKLVNSPAGGGLNCSEVDSTKRLDCEFKWTPSSINQGRSYSFNILYTSSNSGLQIQDSFSINVENDTDGDGVYDSEDMDPLNEDVVNYTYYPSETGLNTLVFEDMWPKVGDYDLNDMVLYYNYRFGKNSDNNITNIVLSYKVAATGASQANGFGVKIPGLSRTNISSTKISKNKSASLNLSIEDGHGDDVVYILFDNSHLIHPKIEGKNFYNTEVGDCRKSVLYEVTIELSNPMILSDIGTLPFNPFIFASDQRGREVHLRDHFPTALADMSLFNTEDDFSLETAEKYYRTIRNLPFAINLSTDSRWNHPKEQVDIVLAYPRIIPYANSNGETDKDWFLVGDNDKVWNKNCTTILNYK